MNRSMTAPVLEPVGQGRVALESVNVAAGIENLLCQTTIRQRYRNLEEVNIEAVYTFPLPLGAVLLDMTVKTRARELKGVVVGKAEAGPAGTTARMAAAREIPALDDPEAVAALGVQYQLMTRRTNYLAVDVKADGGKAGDMPALRKTPQMLAAGWGGTGTVVRMNNNIRSHSSEAPLFLRRQSVRPAKTLVRVEAPGTGDFEKRHVDPFISRLNRLHAGWFSPPNIGWSIDDLVSLGVPSDVVDALKEMVDAGIDEKIVVVVFLYLLSLENQIKGRLTRATRRVLAKAYKQLQGVPDEVRRRMPKAGDFLFV